MNACTYIVVWDKKNSWSALFQYADPVETGVADYHASNHFFYFAVEELKKNLFCNGYSYLS